MSNSIVWVLILLLGPSSHAGHIPVAEYITQAQCLEVAHDLQDKLDMIGSFSARGNYGCFPLPVEYNLNKEQ